MEECRWLRSETGTKFSLQSGGSRSREWLSKIYVCVWIRVVDQEIKNSKLHSFWSNLKSLQILENRRAVSCSQGVMTPHTSGSGNTNSFEIISKDCKTGVQFSLEKSVTGSFALIPNRLKCYKIVCHMQYFILPSSSKRIFSCIDVKWKCRLLMSCSHFYSTVLSHFRRYRF